MECEREECNNKHDGSFGSGRFCSLYCANSRKKQIQKVLFPCIECGEKVLIANNYPRKFVKCKNCNPEKPKRKPRKITYCAVCGNIKGNKNTNCCGAKCATEFKKKELFRKVEENHGVNCSSTLIKKYLILKYGHKCWICDNTEWMNQPIPLIIDHINGRANDNNLDNMRIVCGNCDMQLPTYKSKNKNSDRKYRKKCYGGLAESGL